MSTTPHHDADRETLSALFDGELQGAAARFAVKRLDHDAQWRDACGRWQLLGDTLRGQATGVAPTGVAPMGFADRISAALAGEDVVATASAATTHTQTAMPTRRRWVGGAALAASVAVAALFVAQPFSQSNLPLAPAPPVVANAQPAAPATGDSGLIARQSPDDLSAPVGPSPTPQSSTRPAVEVALATTAVAVAAVPRRTSKRGSREAGPPVAPASAKGRIDHSLTVADAPTAIASNADAMPAGMEPSSTHPFLPQGEIISRPWPRAVLPDYPVGSAFTASFDSNAGPASSSFYPFEPRMLDTDRSLDTGRSQDPGATPPDWPRR